MLHCILVAHFCFNKQFFQMALLDCCQISHIFALSLLLQSSNNRAWAENQACTFVNAAFNGYTISSSLMTETAEDCKNICHLTVGCEGFTWIDNINEGADKQQKSCWLKKDIEEIRTETPGAISALRNCSNSNSKEGEQCCKILHFDFTTREHQHTTGFYQQAEEGENGTWIYEQIGGHQRKLWLNAELEEWFIGDKVGSKSGYILADEAEVKCPENLTSFKYAKNGTWRQLTDARIGCRNSMPDIEPDSCIKGAKCANCTVSVEHREETFCCNNYCNSGWIKVNSKQDILCKCGHE